jgi:hypothetical protein
VVANMRRIPTVHESLLVQLNVRLLTFWLELFSE